MMYQNSKGELISLDDVYFDLELRFTSGNKIPVERATITKDEWEVIKLALNEKE